MRRGLLAVLALLTGVGAILGVGRALRRPHPRQQPPAPIPPTPPPGTEEGPVPRSTHPTPDRADAPIGAFLTTAPRREQMWVAALVIAVCVAGGLIFLFLLPRGG